MNRAAIASPQRLGESRQGRVPADMPVQLRRCLHSRAVRATAIPYATAGCLALLTVWITHGLGPLNHLRLEVGLALAALELILHQMADNGWIDCLCVHSLLEAREPRPAFAVVDRGP